MTLVELKRRNAKASSYIGQIVQTVPQSQVWNAEDVQSQQAPPAQPSLFDRSGGPNTRIRTPIGLNRTGSKANLQAGLVCSSSTRLNYANILLFLNSFMLCKRSSKFWVNLFLFDFQGRLIHASFCPEFWRVNRMFMVASELGLKSNIIIKF